MILRHCHKIPTGLSILVGKYWSINLERISRQRETNPVRLPLDFPSSLSNDACNEIKCVVGIRDCYEMLIRVHASEFFFNTIFLFCHSNTYFYTDLKPI